MNHRHRSAAALTGMCVALSAGAAVSAEGYPSKPIRMIVPAAPGGTTDIAARLLGEKMSPDLGQPVVIENRAGAAGIIGVKALLSSPADGHTLMMGNIGPNAINYALYKNPGYKPEDMIAITAVISNPNVLVVHPSVPARSVRQLVALARSNPGQLAFASSGRGQSVHMSGELFKMKAALDLVHVPYKGTGPALRDVIAGQVHMIFSSLPSTMGFIRDRRLHALAVTSGTRAPELPQIPTMSESGYPDFQVTGWFGLFAPAKTPPAVIDRVYRAARDALATADIKARFTELGGTPGGEPPEQFAKFVLAEKSKWAQVAASARIAPE
jgi:tripartite-type tricarboxylate transporter receptor subunit TctC